MQIPNKPVRAEITLTESDLEDNVCNCEICTNKLGRSELTRLDYTCPLYIPRLLKAYPLGDLVEGLHGDLYPIMGGYIPRKIIDQYADAVLKRLNDLSAEERKKNQRDAIFRTDPPRRLYLSDLLESERRDLHTAILNNAGFGFMECTKEAEAFKIVIEKHVETRAIRMGLI